MPSPASVARSPESLPWRPSLTQQVGRAVLVAACVLACAAPAAAAVLATTHGARGAAARGDLGALASSPVGWGAFTLLWMLAAVRDRQARPAAAPARTAGAVAAPALGAVLAVVATGAAGVETRWMVLVGAAVLGAGLWRLVRPGPAKQRSLPGQVLAGEVWWAPVAFEDGSGSKDRPCLVLRRDGERVYVLMFTSKDHSSRGNYLPAPAELWRRPRESWLRTDRVITLQAGQMRRRESVDTAWTRHVTQQYLT